MWSLAFVLIIIHIYCSAKPILIFYYFFILHRPIRNNELCRIYKKNFLQCRFTCLAFKALPLKSCFVLSKSSDSGFRECQWYCSSNSLPIGNTSSSVSSLKGENWTAISKKIVFSRNSVKHAGYFEWRKHCCKVLPSHGVNSWSNITNILIHKSTSNVN